MPMIEHVCRRALLADGVDEVFVATCDEDIRNVTEALGVRTVMTDASIPRPGLRVAAACSELGVRDDDIVVVVQGDEPLVHPEMIESAGGYLRSHEAFDMGTLVGQATREEWLDPNEVKVVVDQSDRILYMSRAPIPSNERDEPHRALKQVAIMPFRMHMLQRFQALPMLGLEIIESVELVRALEQGVPVAAIRTPYSNVSVDTPQGLAEAEAMMKTDSLFARYGTR
jgi:3-deoxy-manno-octulosonate cytidylyltransferase (CMP-KDO synthetase)